jgi:formylglycine-generating enzyme required for sulfatase activity
MIKQNYRGGVRMSLLLKILAPALLLAALLFVGCASDGDEELFAMVYVPGGITFPTGVDDNVPETVSDAYWIGETEVTYELWSTVYTWATEGTRGTGAGQYSFANPGTQGSDGNQTDLHPVTNVNWRDAMVFCNAITEWYNDQNGTSYTCTYYTDPAYNTPIRTSTNSTELTGDIPGSQDAPYIKSDATGFRLLTNDEWELAARYITDDGDKILDQAGEYYPYEYASGAHTFHNDTADVNPANGVEDGKDANDAVAVYGYYWDDEVGDYFTTYVSSTAEVKSKSPNALGLYDMSGNVQEWVGDATGPGGAFRFIRGGSWLYYSFGLRVGYTQSSSFPYPTVNNTGFHLAQNAD